LMLIGGGFCCFYLFLFLFFLGLSFCLPVQ
jgi:hypothetical protein